jgi:hypothetical protein
VKALKFYDSIKKSASAYPNFLCPLNSSSLPHFVWLSKNICLIKGKKKYYIPKEKKMKCSRSKVKKTVVNSKTTFKMYLIQIIFDPQKNNKMLAKK